MDPVVFSFGFLNSFRRPSIKLDRAASRLKRPTAKAYYKSV